MSGAFSVVVAAGGSHDRWAMGAGGALPWARLDEDMRHFVRVTTMLAGNSVIVMGRRTWDSMSRPGPVMKGGRHVRVVTRSIGGVSSETRGSMFFTTLREAVDTPLAEDIPHATYVVGGAEILRSMLEDTELYHRCSTIYLTEVLPVLSPLPAAQADAVPDVFMPRPHELLADFEELDPPFRSNTDRSRCVFHVYDRRRTPYSDNEEMQYVRLVRRIVLFGEAVTTERTGTGTLSVAGAQLRFSLRGGRFPLLTCKRTWFKGVVRELLWFISGSCDAKVLQKQGVHIWDDNSSRAFLDARGLKHLSEGDIGAGYGHQMRHFGAPYYGCHHQYSGKGVDQLSELVKGLRSDPCSRRHLMSLWNPQALVEMAVPPCHVLTHWISREPDASSGGSRRLTCHLFMRSCDVGLGLPFNIASYALLCHMVALVTGHEAEEVLISTSDTHVYKSHLPALPATVIGASTRLYPFSTIRMDRSVREMDDFREEHISLVGPYQSHPTLSLKMAV